MSAGKLIFEKSVQVYFFDGHELRGNKHESAAVFTVSVLMKVCLYIRLGQEPS